MRTLKSVISHGLVLLLGLAGGIAINLAVAAQESAKPAYLVVAAERSPGVTGQDYAPYQQAAGPLAAAAGLNMIAPAQQAVVFEGSYPYGGTVAIERFSSMQALRDFWYSDGYQSAKKLREGLSTIHFIVGVEGQ